MGDQSDQTNHLAITFEGLSDEDILEAILDMHKPSKNPIVRWLWTGLGSIFVVFAAIGTIVPGWPTTSWLDAA